MHCDVREIRSISGIRSVYKQQKLTNANHESAVDYIDEPMGLNPPKQGIWGGVVLTERREMAVAWRREISANDIMRHVDGGAPWRMNADVGSAQLNKSHQCDLQQTR